MNLSTGAESHMEETTQFALEEGTDVWMTDADTVATYLQPNSPIPPKPIFIQHWYLYTTICICIMSLLGLAGNILTLAAFRKLPRPLKPSDYLVSHLAIADICTCFTAPVYNGFYPTTLGSDIMRQYKYVCLSVLAMALWARSTSLLSILFISVERLLAVIWPLKHMSIVGFKFIKGGIAVVWGVSTFSIILPLLGLNTWRPGKLCKSVQVHLKEYVWGAFFSFPVITLFVVSSVGVIIGVVSWRRNKGPRQGFSSSTKRQDKDKQNKITQMLLTVVGVFFLLWIPFVVISVILAVLYQGKRPPFHMQVLHEISRLVLIITVVANPVIYASRNARFYKAFVKLLKCK